MSLYRRTLFLSLAVCTLLLTPITQTSAQQRKVKKPTALDRYIAQPDTNYAYKLVNTIKKEGYTLYVLQLTSQKYRSEAEVNRTIWQHWLTIAQPDAVKSSMGFLFITGGSVDSKAPTNLAPNFTDMAVRTGSVVAELRGVPNEPLTFKDETKSRTEDEIIAYTWEKYLKTGDETWPLRLPMTKSAVRAMDAVTAFSKSTEGGKTSAKVEKYVVSGGSKRGWTTWTTAAVDSRVVAIVPYVIDCLNNELSMDHHFRSYGFWAPAIGDYWKLHNWAGTPQHKALMEIEDPYNYRERLTMPKYIVNSTGDQYFLPDSWQFYYDDLPGEKYLRYVPNTKHNLEGSDAPLTLDAFYESIQKGTPRPRFTWKIDKDGTITVNSKDKPTEVRLWQANNPKARDFRLDIIGKAYKSEVIQPVKEGVYIARPPKTEAGYTAYFLEMTYPSGGKYPFKFTTGVRITPDTLPFPAPPRQVPTAATATK